MSTISQRSINDFNGDREPLGAAETSLAQQVADLFRTSDRTDRATAGTRNAPRQEPQGATRPDEFGPGTVVPPSDDRSAQEIIDATPSLANLSLKDKEALKDIVGDFEVDRDAAFRAAAVINHIEIYDEQGVELESNGFGDGTITGWTRADRNDRRSEAQHGTEAGRFQDFIKYGYESLKGDAAADGKPFGNEAANGLNRLTPRPDGDDRSAAEIIAGSEILANLSAEDKERMKSHVGDFERDADAAFRAVAVLGQVENYDGDGRAIDNDDVRNGQVDGYAMSDWFGGGVREWRAGTEADRLERFFDEGFDVFTADAPIDGGPLETVAPSGLGRDTTRPEGDGRSAQEILADNPLIGSLPEHARRILERKVGDFENDPDAAFRAAAVVTHMQFFDPTGAVIRDESARYGFAGGEAMGLAWKGSNLEKMFERFSQEGFAALEGDADLQGLPAGATPGGALAGSSVRPEGDDRTAAEILADYPILANLSEHDKDLLRKRVGDFERDPDAAFRAAAVLTHIERLDGDGLVVAGGTVGNGRLDGYTRADRNDPRSEAQPGTEAGRFQDFIRDGFGSLVGRAEADGYPYGAEVDVARPGIDFPDGLPAMPIGIEDRAGIQSSATAIFFRMLEDAPEGSAARTLHNLLKIHGAARNENFEGQIDEGKLNADIHRLLGEADIHAMATEARAEAAAAMGVDPRAVVEEAERILKDDAVWATLNEQPDGVRQRYVDQLLETVSFFDPKKAQELHGEAAQRVMADAMDPASLEDLSATAIGDATLNIVESVIATARLGIGTAANLAKAWEKVTPEQRQRMSALLGEFIRSNRPAEDFATFARNFESNAAVIPSELVDAVDGWVKDLAKKNVFGALGSLLAAVHGLFDVGYGKDLTDPRNALNLTADMMSMTGQLGGVRDLLVELDIIGKTKGAMKTVQDLYDKLRNHFESTGDGQLPPELTGDRPPSAEDLREVLSEEGGSVYEDAQSMLSEYEDALETLEADPDADVGRLWSGDGEGAGGVVNDGPDAEHLRQSNALASQFASEEFQEALDGALGEGRAPITPMDVIEDPNVVIDVIDEGGADVASAIARHAEGGSYLGQVLGRLGILAPAADLIYSGLEANAARERFEAGDAAGGTLSVIKATGLAIAGGVGAAGALGVTILAGPLGATLVAFGLATAGIAILADFFHSRDKINREINEINGWINGGSGTNEDYSLNKA